MIDKPLATTQHLASAGRNGQFGKSIRSSAFYLCPLWNEPMHMFKKILQCVVPERPAGSHEWHSCSNSIRQQKHPGDDMDVVINGSWCILSKCPHTSRWVPPDSKRLNWHDGG